MSNVSQLAATDRLYVLAGTEAEYRAYVLDLAKHGILLGDRIRRCVDYRSLAGATAWRGPDLYYIGIGTWQPTAGENLAQLLHQCGAQPLEYWTL